MLPSWNQWWYFVTVIILQIPEGQKLSQWDLYLTEVFIRKVSKDVTEIILNIYGQILPCKKVSVWGGEKKKGGISGWLMREFWNVPYSIIWSHKRGVEKRSFAPGFLPILHSHSSLHHHVRHNQSITSSWNHAGSSSTDSTCSPRLILKSHRIASQCHLNAPQMSDWYAHTAENVCSARPSDAYWLSDRWLPHLIYNNGSRSISCQTYSLEKSSIGPYPESIWQWYGNGGTIHGGWGGPDGNGSCWGCEHDCSTWVQTHGAKRHGRTATQGKCSSVRRLGSNSLIALRGDPYSVHCTEYRLVQTFWRLMMNLTVEARGKRWRSGGNWGTERLMPQKWQVWTNGIRWLRGTRINGGFSLLVAKTLKQFSTWLSNLYLAWQS